MDTWARRAAALVRGMREDAKPPECTEDPNAVAEVYAVLEHVGCRQWVESQIRTFTDSHFTNLLAKSVEFHKGFLQGKVYGFVLAKSGDRELAEKAGRVALVTALHNNREV